MSACCAPLRPAALAAVLVSLVLLAYAPASARRPPLPGGAPPFAFQGSMALSGEWVHNVGELQMNITNFGVFGSYPNAGWAMSESPSAQWPAGSGVEYLWSAGLWCGARVSGIPRVTTSEYAQWEFRPGIEPVHTIYSAAEGARGGNRLPSPAADDDNDGSIDEDPLNGIDDDGDGLVDEDFAAISNQMFRCTYRDDLPECYSISSDHQALNIFVVQESYQWENDRVDDFVGVEFTIHNRGEATLEDFFLAFYADPDVGGRGLFNPAEDDLVTYADITTCVRKGVYNLPVTFAMGIAYDRDGDPDEDYPAEGAIGIMFLGHTIDPTGETAPERVTLRSWQAFQGSASFEDGGDPVNDDQRYQLMSAENADRPPTVERDYRMLLSCGPFLVEHGDSLKFQVAFVVGDYDPVTQDYSGLFENAAQAKLTYDGNWFDLDNDVTTGVWGAETLLYNAYEDMEWTNPCMPFAIPIFIHHGERVWVNNDCLFEQLADSLCPSATPFQTGVDGKESQVNWLFGSPPPPPNVRIWPTESGNVIFWDNFSETVPDVSELIYDFEGYRVWRADNWHRPYGSSAANGPPTDLWMLLGEYDVPNDLGPDTGLESLFYQPNTDAALVAYYEQALLANSEIMSPLDCLPPMGFSLAEADTAICLAKHRLGMPGGKIYYRYVDDRVHAGMHYFYSVTATDHVPVVTEDGYISHFEEGLSGDPSGGFVHTVPQSASQPAWNYHPDQVYVVPNPATGPWEDPDTGEYVGTLAPWRLDPNNYDPTGVKIEFRHLPAARCTIRIYTLAGDLVETLIHDACGDIACGDYASTGTAAWDLVSRNGQDIASGVYIFSVEADGFERKVGKFTVIR